MSDKDLILAGFDGTAPQASIDPAKSSAIWDVIIKYLPTALPLILSLFSGGFSLPLIGAILKIIADALKMLPEQARADIEKALSTAPVTP